MKFGKKIVHAAASSAALCPESQWLDYKQLKRLLKSFETSHAANPAAAQPQDQPQQPSHPASHVASKQQQQQQRQQQQQQQPPPLGFAAAPPPPPPPTLPRVHPQRQRAASVHDLANSDDERLFFRFLRAELGKVSAAFADLERGALVRFLDMMRSIEDARARYAVLPPGALEALVARLTGVHRQLILLRNFAVLNYCGFTKILKKHDKVTGFSTRDKYMLRVVAEQPFAEHATLKRALEMLNDEYVALRAGALAQEAAPGARAERMREVAAHAGAGRSSTSTSSSSGEGASAGSKRPLTGRETRDVEADETKHAPRERLLAAADDEDDTADGALDAQAAQPLLQVRVEHEREDVGSEGGARARKRSRTSSSHMSMSPTSSEDPLFSLMHAAELHARIAVQQERHVA